MVGAPAVVPAGARRGHAALPRLAPGRRHRRHSGRQPQRARRLRLDPVVVPADRRAVAAGLPRLVRGLPDPLLRRLAAAAHAPRRSRPRRGGRGWAWRRDRPQPLLRLRPPLATGLVEPLAAERGLPASRHLQRRPPDEPSRHRPDPRRDGHRRHRDRRRVPAAHLLSLSLPGRRVPEPLLDARSRRRARPRPRRLHELPPEGVPGGQRTWLGLSMARVPEPPRAQQRLWAVPGVPQDLPSRQHVRSSFGRPSRNGGSRATTRSGRPT